MSVMRDKGYGLINDYEDDDIVREIRHNNVGDATLESIEVIVMR